MFFIFLSFKIKNLLILKSEKFMPKKKVKSNSISGTVQWFDSIRGVGFIKTDEGNLVYVNYTDLPIKNGNFIVLNTNQRVIFDIKTGARGPQAINIKIVK